MNVDQQLLNSIKANTALVISELGPQSDVVEFGLNKPSVAWVEGFIERQRQHKGLEEGNNRLVDVLGSFLGEAIIAQTDGHWARSEEGGLGVMFKSGGTAFPFSKVAKQFSDGLEAGESILSFYDFSTKHAATGRFGE